MKLKEISIENFRGYRSRTIVTFDDLTAFVGKNDIGKSTILEALDIFFNDGKGLIKLTKDDISKVAFREGVCDIRISATFNNLPNKVILDETNETDLSREYLLNKDGDFEIVKVFKNAQTTANSIKILIKANHPSNIHCKDLLSKKNAELKKVIEELNLVCDKTRNAEMRTAIWEYYKKDLNLIEQDIDISGSKGDDLKSIWDKLQTYLPYYSLFQSDRRNSDSDDEIQDPLKEAVKQIMADEQLLSKLNEVAETVKKKLQEVSNLTLEKLKEMNPDIANSLHPRIPDTKSLKWPDVFKGLSIAGDEDIPINKRGSGVKRLILLNFFRAEAERRMKDKNQQNIIYAIEEPETSQHKEHQKMLIDAFKKISSGTNTQIIITTHSADIVKMLRFEQLKLAREKDGQKEIINIEKSALPYPSLNEVNYLAFGEVSEEYHNELYGFIQSKAILEDSNNENEKHFEQWLMNKGCIQSKQWVRILGGIPKPAQPCTLSTYIRNHIHHPENHSNTKYTTEELTNSTIEMKQIAQSFL